MATTAQQAASGPNGSVQPQMKELLEYEKILNIRDEIFSGHHPRLKVPQHVIRNFSPRSIQTPPTFAPPPSQQLQQQQQHQLQLQQQLQQHQLQQQQQQQGAEPLATAKGQETRGGGGTTTGAATGGGRLATAKPASEIDPIFLTKSDDLIRAEIQLQRQRLERALRDQFEQKRFELALKPSPQELKPDFDVSEVLAKAFELVPPTSVSEVEAAAAANNGTNAASDSFDENSFYSSRAPDSPPTAEPVQESPVSEKQPVAMEVDTVDADTRVDRRSNGAREYGRPDYGSVGNADTRTQRPDLARRSPGTPRMRESSPGPVRMAAPPAPYEEPEYSPPDVDVPMDQAREPVREFIPQQERPTRRQSHYRASESEKHQQQRNPPPSYGLKVVNNHITSPAAPQPSRVSPLAVSRVSSMGGRSGRQDRQGDKASTGRASGRNSPEGPSQPLMSRKRRKIQGNKERREERRAVATPDIPYIKPEPVSPPPFFDAPTAPSYGGPRVIRGTAADMEMPPQYARYSPAVDRRESARAPPVYEERYSRGYEVEAPVEVVPRASSRIAYTRPARDTQDLRRIASLQNARQEYLQDYPEPEPEPRYTRAASYTVSDRAAPAERGRYYEEPPQPRYVTRPVSPPSPRFRDEYVEVPRAMPMAPPPQRRVVVDADGNQYYETMAAPKVPAGVPSPRYVRAEEFEEPVSARARSVRAVSVMEHPYGERRYQQEMPPPPPVTYRRAPEYARSVAPESRVYDRDIAPRHPVIRTGSVQVVDYPARRVPYAEDEPHYPREEVVRMPSVRPPPARYEETREPMPRMQSVRPVGREMSVYIDDEPRAHRDYVPVERVERVERVGYAPGRPVREERYYEDEEPVRVPLERGPEIVRRVSRHY